MMNRRSFLGTMLVAAAAPAIVRAQSLMPVRAPSSTAAIVDAAVAAIHEHYGLGVLDVMSSDGRVLASLAVGGALRNGGTLSVKPGIVEHTGVYKEAILNLPGLGRFKVETSCVGATIAAGDEVTCAAGLNVTMDRSAELVAGGVLPGVLVSAL